MGTVNSLLVTLVISVAPLLGYLVSRFAKEELAPGKKWFMRAKRILFVIIAGIFLFAHKWQIWHMTLGLLVLFAYLAFASHREWWVVWGLLGVAYALTAQAPLAFLLGTGIFLYGLLAGAVLAGVKKIQGAIAAGAVFLGAAGILLYFL